MTKSADPAEGTQLLETTSKKHPVVLIRHDSEFSVGSAYSVGAEGVPLLNVWQGAALLIADCLGTGLLALPSDIRVLGVGLGLGFLVACLPINLYAGTILHLTAAAIEERQSAENRIYQENLSAGCITPWKQQMMAMGVKDDEEDDDVDYREVNQNTVSSVISVLSAASGPEQDYQAINQDTLNSAWSGVSFQTAGTTHTQLHHDTATFDFIGMTQALFHDRVATRWVMAIYYLNIFLVLGNYILVMSHAVAAVIGENRICIPEAGLIASIGMFLVSQFRTMARLGRTASILSLAALFIVVVQCLWALQTQQQQMEQLSASLASSTVVQFSLLRKLSALGSIGFACGSQKLFCNIRHELADRSVAPWTLAIAITVFGTFYVLIVLVAGPNPPALLFDAIQPGWNRRIAGLLLWGHVVVSYAINSQAICSSMDRLLWHQLESFSFSHSPALRWMMLSGVMAIAAYTVANAIPFFTDLVSLIGAMTAVPLTLLLPAIFWRKNLSVPLWCPTSDSIFSIALTYFSVIFMVTATVGSLYSIQQDWSKHGGPFSCH